MTTNSFDKASIRGQSLQEYGLILGLVVIAAIPAVMLLGGQSSQGIQAVNQNSGQIKQMASILDSPSTPALVSNAPTLSPRIPLNGIPTRFQLNPATGKIEPVPDSSNLGASGGSGNTTSAEGLVSQLLKDLDGTPQGQLSPTQQAKMQSIRELAERLNDSYAASGSPTASGGGAASSPTTAPANSPHASSGVPSLSLSGSTPADTIKIDPNNATTLTTVPPDVLKDALGYSNLTPNQQAWVDSYAYLQSNVSTLSSDPAFVQSNPETLQQLTLLSNATLYNNLLPMLDVTPQQLVTDTSTYVSSTSLTSSQLTIP